MSLPLTRRSLLRALLALPAAVSAVRATEPGPPPLRRDYRADAVILLFSLPIYTRDAVGGGFAVMQAQGEPETATELLQFGAGSDPARSRGLNRLGFIEEVVSRPAGAPRRSRYTGFMTASEEQTFAEARSVLNQHGETVQYVAIAGEVSPGASRSRSLRFETPADWNWTRFDQIQPLARRTIRETRPDGPEVVVDGHQAQCSFLAAMMETILDPAVQTSRNFVYGGGEHRLTGEKRTDAKMARRLGERGLTKRPEHIVAIHGRVEELRRGGGSARFRVWFEREAANPLPLRIEFQPKAFLALAFEARRPA